MIKIIKTSEYNNMLLDLAELRQKLKEKETIKEPISKDTHERIAELEVKMSKLWTLLLETDARGKDKTTKFGRLFGRSLKHNNP